MTVKTPALAAAEGRRVLAECLTMAVKRPSVATKTKHSLFATCEICGLTPCKETPPQMFGVWAVFSMLQPVSENVTVRDSVDVALFVIKLQALGSKITSEARRGLTMSVLLCV
jgi:hypothetical protein